LKVRVAASICSVVSVVRLFSIRSIKLFFSF
jgi:hypothetical protein